MAPIDSNMNIETKLNVGDKVWAMVSNAPLEHTIERIEIVCLKGGPYIKYIARIGQSTGVRSEFYEEQLCKGWFLTKKELVNSLF